MKTAITYTSYGIPWPGSTHKFCVCKGYTHNVLLKFCVCKGYTHNVLFKKFLL